MNAHLQIIASELRKAGFLVSTVTSTCIEVFLTRRSISTQEVSTALENAMDFDPATDYTRTDTGSVLVHLDLE